YQSVQGQTLENSSYNTKSVQKTNTKEFIIAPKVLKKNTENSPHNTEGGKNKYQRIHHSAQGQMPENLSHNTKENSPCNAKGVQEQTPKNLSRCKRTNAKEFTICSKTNTKEFIIVHKDKYQRIYHTMPKIFKNTKEFITVSKVPKEQMLENSLPNAEGVQEQIPESLL
ncbi:45100_t:CDS:2, partial [Gigaspora margarita]